MCPLERGSQGGAQRTSHLVGSEPKLPGIMVNSVADWFSGKGNTI